MKSQSWPLVKQLKTTIRKTPVFLYDLVSRLQVGLLHQASGKKSVIINDVDKSHSIPVDNEILAYIVGSIMSNAVYSTSDCCIRVETVQRQDAIEVRVRNNGLFRYSSSMNSLGPLAEAARKIGCNIGLEQEENYGMSVILSFATTVAA
jgi:signal transduction histidine kinase